MDSQWQGAVGTIERFSSAEQGERRLHRGDRMCLHVSSLEDRHKTVAGGLIDIAASRVNPVQESRKIAFDQPIQDLQRQLLAQARIASDIEKQDRDIARVFGQFWRFRIGGD